MGDFFDRIMDEGKTPKDLLNHLLRSGPIDIEEAAQSMEVEPARIVAWCETLGKRGLIEVELVNGRRRIRPGKMLLSSLRNLSAEQTVQKQGRKAGAVLDPKSARPAPDKVAEARKDAISELEDKLLREKKKNAELEDKIVDLRLEYERRLAENAQEFNEQLERERSERQKLERLLEMERLKVEGSK